MPLSTRSAGAQVLTIGNSHHAVRGIYKEIPCACGKTIGAWWRADLQRLARVLSQGECVPSRGVWRWRWRVPTGCGLAQPRLCKGLSPKRPAPVISSASVALTAAAKGSIDYNCSKVSVPSLPSVDDMGADMAAKLSPQEMSVM